MKCSGLNYKNALGAGLEDGNGFQRVPRRVPGSSSGCTDMVPLTCVVSGSSSGPSSGRTDVVPLTCVVSGSSSGPSSRCTDMVPLTCVVSGCTDVVLLTCDVSGCTDVVLLTCVVSGCTDVVPLIFVVSLSLGGASVQRCAKRLTFGPGQCQRQDLRIRDQKQDQFFLKKDKMFILVSRSPLIWYILFCLSESTAIVYPR